MKVYSVIFGLLSIATTLTTSCGDPKPVHVGLVAPLTQFSTELGNQGRDGAILAVEEINAKGGIHGRMVQLNVRDVGGGPDSCERILHNLLDSGNSYIVGPFTSNMAQRSRKAMKGSGALMITPTMSSDVLDNLDDEILRVQPSNHIQSQSIANYMRDSGIKRAVVVYDASNREYAQSLVDSFIVDHKANQGVILGMDSIVPGTRTPTQVGKALGALDADAFFIVTTGANLAILVQNIRQAGNKARSFGASWGMTPELIEQGGKAVEGMVFSAPTPPPGAMNASNHFEERFQQRFNRLPSFAAVEAYEGVQALAMAMAQGNPDKPEEIKQILLSQKAISGIYDDFRWNKTGDVIRPQTLVKVENRTFVKVSKSP